MEAELGMLAAGAERTALDLLAQTPDDPRELRAALLRTVGEHARLAGVPAADMLDLYQGALEI